MDGPQTHALADRLDERLTGAPIERIDVPADRWQANVMMMNCVGQVIQRVHARGAWLLIDFSHGVTWMCRFVARSRGELVEEGASGGRGAPLLRMMQGRGRGFELWGRPILAILPTSAVAGHEELQALGPEPPRAGEDQEAFVDTFAARMREASGRTVAAALLDGTIVAGLGNALKCEALFVARRRPAARVAELLASEARALGLAVAEVYRRALADGRAHRRRHHAVYDRAGDPCERCGGAIVADRSGSDGRTSWYCPACQLDRAPPPRLF